MIARRCLALVLLASASTAVAQTAEESAAALVARMTLEEKAAQIKHEAPAIPRLGVPEYNWWNEGLHGVARAGEATVFPQAIGLAATWDTKLIHRVADTIATEFRAKFVASRLPDGGSKQYRGLTVWSPNVNIFRDPRWGRGQETWGEDPYLTSRFGVAFITGLQGDDPARYKTAAVVKHFAVHSGPESDRHKEDVHPSPRDLEETYLPAFRAAVTEAKVEGVMCAYNAVSGIPACASPLIADRIRGDWGFKGHVVSDCWALMDFFLDDAHRYSKTPEQAAAAAINAGTDSFCGGFSAGRGTDPKAIVDAVRQGLLSEAAIDRAMTRLFAVRYRLGLFDKGGTYADIPASANDTPAHATLNRDAAQASLVLLKNDGLLPLKAPPRSIAVIGPNADSVDALVGNYNGTPSAPVTILKGLRERFPNAAIRYVEGTGHIGAPLKPTPAARLCRDAGCTRPGVRVEEYRMTDLGGESTRSEDSADIRVEWGRPAWTPRTTSIRWTGFLRPDATGPYRFGMSDDDGYRIFIDGREVVNAWNPANPEAFTDTEIRLEAGKSYPIRVEAIQDGNRGDQRLLWSSFAEGGDAAIEAARAADLVVFAGGLTPKLEGEEMRVRASGFVGGDRTTLDLPAPRQKLLERLHATGKPVVLVLMNGSAMSVNWADANLPAIVEAWYPGGAGGHAVAGLIAGDFSPSGRLPVTFYKSADQLPPFKDYAMAGRTYRYFAGEPLYRFGHGLNYTRFTYGKPLVAKATIRAGETARVSIEVTNSGEMAGDEVVQLYLSHPAPGAPIRALQGFERLRLQPGETRRVIFTLDPRALSQVDAAGARSVEPGRVALWIGSGQPGAGVAGGTASLTVTGKLTLGN